MTTTDREIETIAFYAGQLAALATELRTTREDLKRATSDRDAYGEGIHALGARVAGLQTKVLEAERERDEARIRVGELLMKQEGTGAAPPAAVDPAQCVTAPETPTRTEPAGRSALPSSDDLAAEHRASFPPADELSDERIPFVPAETPPAAAPADPFLDELPAPDPKAEEPKAEPWWRYAVGPPASAYHLFASSDAGEAECGETTDDETRPAPNLPPHEQTCMDCMDLAVQRGIKVPAASEPPPEEPPEPADTQEQDADEGAAPGRKYARKPRVCIVPGCDRPGHAAKNEHGARDSGGLWCDEHAKSLTAEERRDLHARDKAWKRKLKREAAAKAKAPEEAA